MILDLPAASWQETPEVHRRASGGDSGHGLFTPGMAYLTVEPLMLVELIQCHMLFERSHRGLGNVLIDAEEHDTVGERLHRTRGTARRQGWAE